MACLCLTATAAAQSKTNPRRDVVLRGCMQAEPRPASASGRPVLIMTNARVSPDIASAAGSPSGVGTTFILQRGKDDLSNYIGKLVEVRASIAQSSDNAPEAVGTSGSNESPEVEAQGWPRARVKEIHSVGDCTK